MKKVLAVVAFFLMLMPLFVFGTAAVKVDGYETPIVKENTATYDGVTYTCIKCDNHYSVYYRLGDNFVRAMKDKGKILTWVIAKNVAKMKLEGQNDASSKDLSEAFDPITAENYVLVDKDCDGKFEMKISVWHKQIRPDCIK